MQHTWGQREIRIGYWWESQKERGHWEDLDVEIGLDGVDWIDVSQDRDQ
jgi:hypothetical protein